MGEVYSGNNGGKKRGAAGTDCAEAMYWTVKTVRVLAWGRDYLEESMWEGAATRVMLAAPACGDEGCRKSVTEGVASRGGAHWYRCAAQKTSTHSPASCTTLRMSATAAVYCRSVAMAPTSRACCSCCARAAAAASPQADGDPPAPCACGGGIVRAAR